MKLKLICKTISTIIFGCLAFHTGCSGGADDAKPKDPEKGVKDQKPQAVLKAVICTIDITNKTVCVLPWEKNEPTRIGDAALLKRDAPRVFAWEGDTKLVSKFVRPEGNTITIAQCIQGEPLSTDCKRLTDLEGELTLLHIETAGARDVVRKVEVLGAFDRDTFPVWNGTNTVQAVGGPVKCDVHKTSWQREYEKHIKPAPGPTR